jgi:hypothetical protein
MGEHDPIVSLPVGQLSDPLTVEQQLVPVRLGDVDDHCVVRRCRPQLARLEIPRIPEVFDELAGRIRFACVPVIGETPSVRSRESPWLAVPEVGEDRAGAAQDLSVLGLQDRNLIGTSQLAEPFALLRPWLDLPDDGVDAELGEHFANR